MNSVGSRDAHPRCAQEFSAQHLLAPFSLILMLLLKCSPADVDSSVIDYVAIRAILRYNCYI